MNEQFKPLSIEMLRQKALDFAAQAAAETDYQKRADLERQALTCWQQMRRLGYRVIVSPNAQMVFLLLIGPSLIGLCL